jgi:hypothetical protein
MRRAEMGGLAEAKTNELALIPKSEDRRTQQARMAQLSSDNCSEITVIRRANAHVAATHRARSAKPDSVSFPV